MAKLETVLRAGATDEDDPESYTCRAKPEPEKKPSEKSAKVAAPKKRK